MIAKCGGTKPNCLRGLWLGVRAVALREHVAVHDWQSWHVDDEHEDDEHVERHGDVVRVRQLDRVRARGQKAERADHAEHLARDARRVEHHEEVVAQEREERRHLVVQVERVERVARHLDEPPADDHEREAELVARVRAEHVDAPHEPQARAHLHERRAERRAHKADRGVHDLHDRHGLHDLEREAHGVPAGARDILPVLAVFARREHGRGRDVEHERPACARERVEREQVQVQERAVLRHVAESGGEMRLRVDGRGAKQRGLRVGG